MKIADFGLARDIHHIDYYKKTTNVSTGKAPGGLFPGQDSAARGCLPFRWPCCNPVKTAWWDEPGMGTPSQAQPQSPCAACRGDCL